MKKIALFVSVFLLCVVYIYADSPVLSGINKNILNSTDIFKPDSQAYSFSTGFLSAGKNSMSYSLLSADYTNQISKNLFLNYDFSYLNTNLMQNYIMGGVGLTYRSDNFQFSVYMNRMFDAEEYNIIH